MKLLVGLVLVAATVPAHGASTLDEALARVPTLTDLCGAVPLAPAKVRGSSVHHPIRRSVKAFIKDTNEWLDCAAHKYVRIQALLDSMQDDWQRGALVDHLNKDYRAQYAVLNDQTQLLAERVNYRLTWLVRPARPVVSSSGVGYSNSKANVLLRKTKRLTYRSDLNRPIHDPTLGLFKWEPLKPLQFQS